MNTLAEIGPLAEGDSGYVLNVPRRQRQLFIEAARSHGQIEQVVTEFNLRCNQPIACLIGFRTAPSRLSRSLVGAAASGATSDV